MSKGSKKIQRKEDPSRGKLSRKNQNKQAKPENDGPSGGRTLLQKIFRYLSLIAFIGTAILILLFFWVDRFVSRRLALPATSQGSAILSDTITLDSTMSAEGILKTLSSRDYARTNDQATVAGQFYVSDKGIQIFRKAYIDSGGTLHKPELQTVSQGSSVTLEPTLLIPLGTTEQKASERVSLEKIPPIIWQAIVAIEDERFYSHFGIDPQAIARALYQNLSSGRVRQGGSTLTQQLAKNLFFSPEKTISRKIQEALAALSLEHHLTKKEILEMYLNETYFGQQGAIAIHGVATATHAFFGKQLSEITVPEAALLAGIIRAPSNYNPRRYPQRALLRRNTVLDKMVENGYISPEAAEQAKKTPITLTPELIKERSAPFFSSVVQQELQTQINLDAYIPQGIQVYSTIEPVLQRCAEDAVTEGLRSLEKKYGRLRRKPSLQAALVSMTPEGNVKAYVGGKDYSVSQFDRASQAVRQIGSTVKPFVYLAALDKSLNAYKVATTQSILEDKPTEIVLETKDVWIPENYEKDYHGDVSLRYALENSLNLPAVMITQKYGVKTLARLLETVGLAEKVDPFPSLALGSISTTLLRLTRSYAALANSGNLPSVQMYRSVIDSNGQIVNQLTATQKQIASAPAVYVLTDVMRGVIERGTGKTVRAAGFLDPAAGKTGTTNDTRDAWFMGFTPQLVGGVWVGFDDNRTLGLTGGAAAAPIWAQYMQCARSMYSPQAFAVPPGVSLVELDSYSGLLWNSSCTGDKMKEVFVTGTEPTQHCGDVAPNSGRSAISGDDEIPEELETSPRRRGERSLWDSLFGR